MAFNETLTVRIEGDSSPLDSALESVVGRVNELSNRLEQVGSAANGLDGIATRLTAAIGPADALSQAVDRVSASIQAISRTPITLNTAPALAALAQLNSTLEATSAQVRAISAAGGGAIPGGGAERGSGGVGDGIPRLADGGIVRGPSGVDRVPAWLTSGEFVVSRPAVERVGLDFLNGLNGVGAMARRAGVSELPVTEPNSVGVGGVMNTGASLADAPASRAVAVAGSVGETGSAREREGVSAIVDAPAAQGVVNHFGGVTIQVREVADVGAVVKEMRNQGLAARKRRG